MSGNWKSNMKSENDQLQSRLTEAEGEAKALQAKLTESEAANAVLREVVSKANDTVFQLDQHIKRHFIGPVNPTVFEIQNAHEVASDLFRKLSRVLESGDTGKDFLEKMERLTKAVNQSVEFAEGVLQVCEFLDNSDNHYTLHTSNHIARLREALKESESKCTPGT